MKANLFTFGCSYTQFSWPTWSVCLSPYFDRIDNYGRCGAGNLFIFTCFSNAVADDRIKKGDTVIIQWSSLVREDRILQNQEEYALGGYAYRNGFYSDKLLIKYFNSFQKGLELIGYITSIIAICKQRGINLKMFHMFEPWIGPSTGEPAYVDIELLNYGNTKLKEYNVLQKIKELCATPSFFPSSLEMLNDSKKYGIAYNKQPDTGNVVEDHHPPSIVHLQYCIKYIYPWLSSLDSTRKVDNIDKLTTNINQWSEFIKDKSKVESVPATNTIQTYKDESLIIPSALFGTNYTEPNIPFKFTVSDLI